MVSLNISIRIWTRTQICILISYEKFQKFLCINWSMDPTGLRPMWWNIGVGFSSSQRFHLLPLLPQSPAAALDAVGPCGALQSSTLPYPAAGLQLESSWCGSNLRTSDKGMPAYSLPFPSRCTKSNTQIPNVRYLFSDLTMILPTKFDLFATVVFVFGSDHDFTCYIRSFCNSYWVYMCTPMS